MWLDAMCLRQNVLAPHVGFAIAYIDQWHVAITESTDRIIQLLENCRQFVCGSMHWIWTGHGVGKTMHNIGNIG